VAALQVLMALSGKRLGVELMKEVVRLEGLVELNTRAMTS